MPQACSGNSQLLKNPYFKPYDGAAVSPQDNSVAEHRGISSLVIHPEDPKLKLDERNGLIPRSDPGRGWLQGAWPAGN